MDHADRPANALERCIYSPIFSSFILSLVAFSVVMLILEKIIDFPVPAVYYIEHLDMIILGIFSLEFVLKFYLRRGSYFFGDYGWIDFLSCLPVFAPAVKVLRGVKILRGVQLLRAMRFIRFLRLFRFLKFYKRSDSVLKQKLFVPISTVTMLLVMFIGMILVGWQESVYRHLDDVQFKFFISTLQDQGADEAARKFPAVLEVKNNEEILFRRYSEEELKNTFLPEHLTQVNTSNYDTSPQNSGLSILFSTKETYRLIQKTELCVMIMSLCVITVLIMFLNGFVDRIILNPLAALTDTMDNVVREVEIPNTGEVRKEIDFSIRVEYTSDDEIGVLARKYDVLLRELESRINQTKSIFRDLVNSMMNLFGEFHNITQGHQIRTSRVARRIGEEMGLGPEDLDSLYYGMMLHDLGKIGVDKNVLTKPGRFTPEERKEMERHPEIGFDIARDFPLISTDELRIIREHHEKFDGSGYPKGLSGEQLSVLSRIAAVADIFDALSCPRDYKTAKSLAEVRNIMERMRGTHLDPAILSRLWELVDSGLIQVTVSADVSEENWITVK